MIAAVAILMQVAVVQPCGDRQNSFRGRTENDNYGYSVTLPPGIVGCNSGRPGNQHGVEVVFHEPQDARIEVDGRYNPDYRDLSEAADQHRVWTKKRAVGKVSFVAAPTLLGSLPAIRTRAEFVARVGKRRLVEEAVLALRPEGNILYAVSYSSPSDQADRVRRVFEGILESWHADALRPKDEKPPKPRADR